MSNLYSAIYDINTNLNSNTKVDLSKLMLPNMIK